MYHRKNHFLFHGFAGLFSLIFLFVMGSLVFRLGLSQGMLATGGEIRSVSAAPVLLEPTNLLIIFGGIILIMILGFVFRLIYWKQIGKERMAFFAEHKAEFAQMGFRKGFRPGYRYHHPGCWDWEDEDHPEKTSAKEKNGEE